MLPQEAISNPTKFKLLLEFQAVFPNETPKSVEEYLLGGRREIILNVAASFLGFNSQKSNFENPKEVLRMFFREENSKIANEIYNRIKELEKNGKEVLILNTYCNLKLFEIFFRIETDKDATQT